MRKVGAFILAVFFIFLAACEQGASVTAKPASSPPPTQAAGPSVTESPAQGSPTPGIKDSENKIIEVFLPAGPVPETGYTPSEQPARFYEDVVKTLVPSNEYGHIWPYLGEYYGIVAWAYGELYGICDEKGRIVCDPVFHQVEVLEKDGAKLYAFYKYSWGEKGSETKITLARPDGSWADVYDKISSVCGGAEFTHLRVKGSYGTDPFMINWRPPITLDYISVCKDGKWGAIDYYGNEIIPCVYNAPLRFSEGLASVLSEDNTQVSFIDSSGNTVIGPYEAPPEADEIFRIGLAGPPNTLYRNDNLVFYQGYVKFYKDGKFGVIDKSGNIVIEAKYDYISSFCDGIAAFLKDELLGVIDANDNVLLEPRESYIRTSGNGVVTVDEGRYYKTINLFTGQDYDIKEDKKVIHNNDGSLTLKLNSGELQYDSRHFAYELSNGYICLTADGVNPTWRIINDSGETVAGPFNGSVDYDGAYGMLYVRQRNEPNSNWSNESFMEVYDEYGERLLPGKYLSVWPFDGRYLVRTDTTIGLLDEKGEWVIKVPLYDYMGD